MMQTANLRNRNDLALRRRLHVTGCWRIPIQREMCSGIVIIVKAFPKDAVQMSFVQHDHVVKALLTYRTDDAFAIGVLPRRAWYDRDFFDSHAFDAMSKVVAIDVVAITKEITWCFLVREGVNWRRERITGF